MLSPLVSMLVIVGALAGALGVLLWAFSRGSECAHSWYWSGKQGGYRCRYCAERR